MIQARTLIALPIGKGATYPRSLTDEIWLGARSTTARTHVLFILKESPLDCSVTSDSSTVRRHEIVE